jgi:multidrug resistance efflux pump
MSSNFEGTSGALEEDGLGRHLVLLAFGAGLLLAWTAWLCLAPLGVEVQTSRARIEAVAMAHPVHAEVEGRVRVSHLELGRQVEQGEVLVELERERSELALQEALARWEANQAVLSQMLALVEAERTLVVQLEVAGQVAVDETSTRAQRAAITARLSERDAQQWALLSEQGAAAAMDATRSQALAEAERALANAERLASRRVEADQGSLRKARQVAIEQLQVEISELQVALAADEVALRRLRAELDARTIRAPHSGRLGWIETMSSGMLLSPGQHLATVVPDSELHVVAHFPAEQVLGRVQPGQRATLSLAAFPSTQHGQLVGQIVRVGAEPKDGQVRIEAAIDETLSGTTPRAHGLEGTLRITVEHTTPLRLLVRALGQGSS